MENPFKQILLQEELPKMLKKKVMDDISFINLTLDMADLFTVKGPETLKDLLGLKKNDK